MSKNTNSNPSSDSESEYKDDYIIPFNTSEYFEDILANLEFDESMLELYRTVELHPKIDPSNFINYAKKVHPDLYFFIDSENYSTCQLIISTLPLK